MSRTGWRWVLRCCGRSAALIAPLLAHAAAVDAQRDEIVFGERYRLDLGVRADYVRFEVRDHLITSDDPDDSGERTLHAVSPMIGFVARVAPLHSVYANISTAFETPTATELGNHPDGSAGINADLDPQFATTYEVGAKGIVLSRLQYDVSIFDTEVRDELIPFEIAGGAGRRYFRNAGRTRRNGFEVGLNATVGAFDLGASYSYSHFRFREYEVDGDVLDGDEREREESRKQRAESRNCKETGNREQETGNRYRITEREPSPSRQFPVSSLLSPVPCSLFPVPL